MKKNLIFFAILTLTTLTGWSQSLKPYPIPSFGATVNGWALFSENGANAGGPSKAKKDGYVKVYTSRPEVQNCGATIYWYSIDGLNILGPFEVSCGETLSTPIDEREWGVLVITEDEIMVDVWIE